MTLSDRLTAIAARVLRPDTARELANAIAAALADGVEPVADTIISAVTHRYIHPATYPGWAVGEVHSRDVLALQEGLIREARVGVSPVARETTTTAEEGAVIR